MPGRAKRFCFVILSGVEGSAVRGGVETAFKNGPTADPSARTKVLGRDDKKIKCNAALKRCTARTKLLRYWYSFFRQASLLTQGASLVGALPGEVRIGTTEVPVGRGLAIDRTPQVERLDDAFR